MDNRYLLLKKDNGNKELLFSFYSEGRNKETYVVMEYIPGFGMVSGSHYTSYALDMDWYETEISENEAATFIAAHERKAREMMYKASALARKLHAGQKDKGGNDYFSSHVAKVADSFLCYKKDNAIGNSLLQTIAYLHDTVEDTPMTLDELRRLGFSETVVSCVDSLTRRDGEDYMTYIARVKKDPIAKIVKAHDLINNMDLSRIPAPDREDRNRTKRYGKALVFLMS